MICVCELMQKNLEFDLKQIYQLFMTLNSSRRIESQGTLENCHLINTATLQSWIFKSICDATATHKITIFKSVSIGGLENTWETPTGSVALVIQQCQ